MSHAEENRTDEVTYPDTTETLIRRTMETLGIGRHGAIVFLIERRDLALQATCERLADLLRAASDVAEWADHKVSIASGMSERGQAAEWQRRCQSLTGAAVAARQALATLPVMNAETVRQPK